ncbi:MAG TPA: 2-dehydropantoate 2-reductase [Steroidobacteraceae bacterium]
MRVLVVGSGGVGGYFGGMLAQGNCEVCFVARGPHLEAMRKAGLRIEKAEGDIHLPHVAVSNDPKSFGVPDVVLLCVKLWDLAAAARAMAPLVGPDTVVLSLQNGVQKDEVTRIAVGGDAVVGSVCYIATQISEPGVIRRTGALQRLVFGEYDREPRLQVARFFEACRHAGIDAVISSDIRRSIWEKFVFLVGFSASTTTKRSAIGPILENPVARAFLLDLMQEVVLVGRAAGVKLDAGYAEDRLAFVDTLPADTKSSMLVDLERGKRLELPWLSGYVAELGMKLGVPTPCNRAVDAVLAREVNGSSATPGAGSA